MIPHPNSSNRHPRGYKNLSHAMQLQFHTMPGSLCTFRGARFQFTTTNMKKIPRRQPLHHSKIISSCRIFEDVPNSVVKRCPGARLSAGGEARQSRGAFLSLRRWEFEVAPTRQVPVHGRQAMPDENYMTLTLTLRISLKRHLFDFCFF